MEIKIFKTAEEASYQALELFKEVKEKGGRVFGLATGSTPEILYHLLAASDLDFSQDIAINLDEYLGLAPQDPQSYAYFMQDHLFNKKPFGATYIPNGLAKDTQAEAERYEAIIDAHPIDLQLLGIGSNGHIGFNEPGTPFDRTTHAVKLTSQTIADNGRFFSSQEAVPQEALSMGISSILKAKQILLMAFGAKKAAAIKGLIEGPMSEDLPVTCLQSHPHVTVLLDEEAAQELTRVE